MIEKQHSLDKRPYRSREQGWGYSMNVKLDPPERVETVAPRGSPVVGLDPPGSVAPQAAPEEDVLDRAFNMVQKYACAGEDNQDYRTEYGDRSIHDFSTGPDALDFMFDYLEEFVCTSDNTTRALQGTEPYWDHNQFDNADRGHVTGEVWSLRKLGENEKRGSVADRIKALEANSSPTNPSRTNAMRPTKNYGSKSGSVTPLWKKAIEKAPESRSDVGYISRSKEVEPRRSEAVVPSYTRSATQHCNGISPSKFQKKQPIPWPQKLKYAQRKPGHPNAVVAKIAKDSPKESSGLSFVSFHEKEGIYISKIRDESKFKETELEQGMKILRINGSPCPRRVKHVVKMVKSANNEVVIEAMKDDSITFVSNEIPRSEDGSPAKPSVPEKKKLETSLNEEAPRDGPPSECNGEKKGAKIFERKESSISIASLDRSEIPVKPKNKKVRARVFKRTIRDKIGISFVSFKKKRGVYVYEMYEDSKFQGTGLEVGMKVLAINDEPCPERVSETLAMVKAIDGELVITAVTPSEEDTATKQSSSRSDKLNEQEAQSLDKLGIGRQHKFFHTGGSDSVTSYPFKRDQFGVINNKFEEATAKEGEIYGARKESFQEDVDAWNTIEESSKSLDEDDPFIYGLHGLS